MYCNSFPCGTVSDLDLEVPGNAPSGGLAAYAAVDHVLVHVHGNGPACEVRPDQETITNTLCVADGTGPALFMGVNFGGGFVGLGFALHNDTFYANPAGGGSGASLYVDNAGSGVGALTITATNTIIRGPTDIVTQTAATGGGSQTMTVALDHSNYASVDSSKGGTVTPAGTATNQTPPPTFVNIATADYHEASGSPTIDAGTNDPASGTTDLDGNPRTVGPATDIGAYEYQAAPAVITGTATNITTTGATLGGTVDAGDLPTTWYVSYGPTTGYGHITQTQALSAQLGAQTVSATLSGLLPGTTYHFQVVAVNAFGTVAGGDRTFTTAPASQPSPSLSGLRVAPQKLSITGRKVNGKCVKPTKKNGSDTRCSRAIELKISYTLNVADTVTFTLTHTAPGRRVNGKCVKPTIKNKHDKKCTRLIGVHGQLVETGNAGANSFSFNGKIGGRKLAPGTYQLTATPTGGNSRSVTFTIVG
jgi:hypothetical protein